MRRLAVTLTVDGVCEILTDRCSDITVRNASPGGFASIEVEIPRKLDAAIYQNAILKVTDQTTAETVCEGRVVDQGRTGGGTWSLSALGTGLAALSDRDEPYMVIDAELEPIAREVQIGATYALKGGSKRQKRKGKKGKPRKPYKIRTAIVSAKVETGPAPNGTSLEGLLFTVPEGTTNSASAAFSAEFRGPWLCGQKLGSYYFRYLCGVANGWTISADALEVGGGSDSHYQTWATSSAPGTWKVHTTNFAATRDSFALRVITGPSTVAGANVWAHARYLWLRSQLLDKDGAVRPGADHATIDVKAEDVFTDIVKRRTGLEIGHVTTGTSIFRQLTWYDGATPKEILDEICEGDPTVTYHAWEDGKIDLDPRVGTVRYQFSTAGGFDSPAPTTEVYGGVIINGIDVEGLPQRYQLTRDPAGRTTTFEMSETWDATAAQAAANLFLDNHAAPPNAGTLTVKETVIDLQSGRLVEPYMIRSGGLCRVSGINGSVDSLNSDAQPDGITIFRIVSVSYSTSSGEAVLELDTNVFDAERALADLLK